MEWVYNFLILFLLDIFLLGAQDNTLGFPSLLCYHNNPVCEFEVKNDNWSKLILFTVNFLFYILYTIKNKFQVYLRKKYGLFFHPSHFAAGRLSIFSVYLVHFWVWFLLIDKSLFSSNKIMKTKRVDFCWPCVILPVKEHAFAAAKIASLEGDSIYIMDFFSLETLENSTGCINLSSENILTLKKISAIKNLKPI